MKIRTLLLSLVLLLQGCAAPAPFNPPEFNKYVVGVVEIDDNIGFGPNGGKIVGQTSFKKGICSFKLPTIQGVYDSYNMCIWGHEFMHCVLGSFHREDEIDTC